MSHAHTHSLQNPSIHASPSDSGGAITRSSALGALARGSAKVLGHVLAWCLGTLFAVVIQAVLSGFAQSAEPVATESVETTVTQSVDASETLVEALVLDDSCRMDP